MNMSGRTRLTTAASSLLATALAVTLGVAVGVLPGSWRPYLWVAWPISIVLALAVAWIGVKKPEVISGGDAACTRARAELLKRVARTWLEEDPTALFPGNSPLELRLAVNVRESNPSNPPSTQARRWKQLAVGCSVPEIFQDLDQAMLILGAPGSGKTTLLKDLLRHLLSSAATEDPDGVIPVFLPLASWTLRRQSIENWVMQEVSERHKIPSKYVRRWLEQEQIILLLDGLDEVAYEYRDDCAKEISSFHDHHGTTAIAVCCRVSEYQHFREQLTLYNCVTIQPLNRQQIERYLEGSSVSTTMARTVLDREPSLWEMVDTPLILNILAHAFLEEVPIEELPGRTPQELLNTLFAQYVPTMLHQRISADYSPQSTIRRLAFLARQLERQEQIVFRWDLIDVDSLPERWWVYILGAMEWFFRLAVSVVSMGTVLGVLFGWPGAFVGAIAGLLSGFSQELRVNSIALALEVQSPSLETGSPEKNSSLEGLEEINDEQRLALRNAITSMLSGPEISRFIDLLIGEMPELELQHTLDTRDPNERLIKLINSDKFMIKLADMAEGELEALMEEVAPKKDLLRRAEAYRHNIDDDYEPHMLNEFDDLSEKMIGPIGRRQALILSAARYNLLIFEWWLHLRQRMEDRFYYAGDLSSSGLLAVLVICVAAWIFLGWPYAVATALSGFITLLTITAAYKLRFRVRTRHLARSFPSPGLRATFRVCIIAAPGVALLAGGIAGVIVALTVTTHQGMRAAIAAAACAALFTVICLGGAALIEQARIRLILQWVGLMPIRSKPFLRYAAHCLFLQQSGQDYLFSHRSLQEFFAGLCIKEGHLGRKNEPDYRLVGILLPPESHHSADKQGS